jgi:hypothetical protein
LPTVAISGGANNASPRMAGRQENVSHLATEEQQCIAAKFEFLEMP